MKSLVTADEAAKLWGCTARHIQWLAKRGELKVWDYRIKQHHIDAYTMMVTRRPLFAPSEVLALRSKKKAERSARAVRHNATHKERIRQSVSKASRRIAKVWKSMPKEERAKWGRRWRRGVAKWLARGAG